MDGNVWFFILEVAAILGALALFGIGKHCYRRYWKKESIRVEPSFPKIGKWILGLLTVRFWKGIWHSVVEDIRESRRATQAHIQARMRDYEEAAKRSPYCQNDLAFILGIPARPKSDDPQS